MTLSLIPDYDLSRHTWLGVGGKADLFSEVICWRYTSSTFMEKINEMSWFFRTFASF